MLSRCFRSGDQNNSDLPAPVSGCPRSGGGVTISGVTVTGTTSLTASVAVDAAADISARCDRDHRGRHQRRAEADDQSEGAGRREPQLEPLHRGDDVVGHRDRRSVRAGPDDRDGQRHRRDRRHHHRRRLPSGRLDDLDGGGSSFGPAGATFTTGFRSGNGQVVISW
jgi:hypothetical protein